MIKIGLLSDTHSYVHPRIFDHFADRDQIWHAGDFGTIKVADQLKAFKPLTGVYGNIDGADVRIDYPIEKIFWCENVKVYMTHIGGYPHKYPYEISEKLKLKKPKLFICGHSHILKIIYDKQYNLLHINPGAAGKYGFHQVITLLKFEIDGTEIKNMQIIEIDK